MSKKIKLSGSALRKMAQRDRENWQRPRGIGRNWRSFRQPETAVQADNAAMAVRSAYVR